MHRFLAGCFILATVFLAFGEDAETANKSADINNELVRLRKELQQVQSQRQNNLQERENEQRDFTAYRARNEKRLASARFNIDSLKRETQKNQSKSDSLDALAQTSQIKKREIELSREALRNRLVNSCDKLFGLSNYLSPMNQGQVKSSIGLVKNELGLKSIESPEAFNRLLQIINIMRDASGSIQTSSGESPVPDIKGACTRLRVGCMMDAVTDPKGTLCYLWNGNNSDGSPLWIAAPDKSTGAEIVHAVAVREGKALPSFVNIPLAAMHWEVAP
jgi:hypothetical protein